MRKRHLFEVIALATLAVAAPAASSELQPVDEVLAVIDGTPILQSDLALASLVGFGTNGESDLSAPGKASRLLDARIRLELQFHDLAGSGAVQRLDIDVNSRVEAIVLRAGDEELLRRSLADNGLAWDDLEALALRLEVTRTWVEERLRPRVVVSLKDVEAAYETLVAAPLHDQGEAPPPLNRVHEQLRTVLEEEKLNVEIDRWVARCREQYQVLRYAP